MNEMYLEVEGEAEAAMWMGQAPQLLAFHLSRHLKERQSCGIEQKLTNSVTFELLIKTVDVLFRVGGCVFCAL
jgi:hypothetical protein